MTRRRGCIPYAPEGFRSFHANVPSAVLTGTNLTRDNEDGTVSGPSIDQLVADQIGKGSRFRSLELATTKGAGASGSAFKWISHNGPDNPNAADSDPRRVFARLFGDSLAAPDPRLLRIAALRKSVLDAVVQDATSLSAKLGSNDRARLEQHLESLRALERKLDGLPGGGACPVPQAPTDVSDEMVTEGGLNANMTTINHVMSSLLAAALVCDQTRVFTYMFTTPACHDAFPEADIFETFHESWHRMGTQSELINRGISYEMDRLADTLTILKDTPDGPGNLLDNLALLSTTDTQDGGNHSIATIPLLVAGSAGGAIKKPGGSIRLDGESATRLPLTLARAVGAPLASFGKDRMKTDSEISEILT